MDVDGLKVIACDQYVSVRENLRAIGTALEASARSTAQAMARIRAQMVG